MFDHWNRRLKKARKLVVKAQWHEAAQLLRESCQLCAKILAQDAIWPEYRGEGDQAAACREVRHALRSTHNDLLLISDFYWATQ